MTMSYGSGANSSVNPEEEIAREGANPLEEPLLTIEWVEKAHLKAEEENLTHSTTTAKKPKIFIYQTLIFQFQRQVHR